MGLLFTQSNKRLRLNYKLHIGHDKLVGRIYYPVRTQKIRENHGTMITGPEGMPFVLRWQVKSPPDSNSGSLAKWNGGIVCNAFEREQALIEESYSLG